MKRLLKKAMITLAIIFALVFGSGFGYYFGAQGVLPPIDERIDSTNIIKNAYELMANHYIEPVAEEELIEGAVNGMIEAAGDPHAYYYSVEEFEQASLGLLDSDYVGIGIEVTQVEEHDRLVIVGVMDEGPAQKANLQVGDQIVEVDQQDITALGIETITHLIRGEEGTDVHVKVRRDEEELDFILTRESLEFQYTRHEMIEDEEGIGYIQIQSFGNGLTGQTQEALDDLQKQGLEKLILDLRHNGGGLDHELVGVASLLFPPETPVFYREYREGDPDAYYSHESEGLDIPLVVLVDEFSASAAEVLAAAVKDLERGTLIGATTFGKGSGQTFVEFGDGSVLQFSVVKALTPEKYAYDGEGIEPHISVDSPSPREFGEESDQQLQQAIEYMLDQ